MAMLRIERGSKAGRRIELERESVTVGRQSCCDLVLDDDTVSRQHARFMSRPEGFFLEDLGSRNGTYLNGERIYGPTRIFDGDRVQLYDITMTFFDSAGLSPRPAGTGSSVALCGETGGGTALATSKVGTVREIDLSSFGRDLERERADARLQAVLDVTRQIQSCLELEELFTRVLESLFRILPQLNRACILRVDETTGQLLLEAVRVREGDLPTTIGPITQTIVKQALSGGKALLSVDVVTEGAASGGDSVHEIENSSVMCAPLMDSVCRAVGALYVDTMDAERPFLEQDLDVLACVAMLAGQALEQATLQNARYRAVVDASVDGIITFNEHGTIESVNAAAVELFAYRPGELRGKDMESLVPELRSLIGGPQPDRPGGRRRTSEPRGEAIARRRDGSTIPVYVSIGEFSLAGRKLFTATLHDITEQKLVESTLMTLNERLEREVRRRTEYIQLHQDVAVIANEAESVPQAFQAALDRIRLFTGWPAAHVYLQWEDDPAVFVDGAIWSAGEGVDRSRLMATACPQRMTVDSGLVGRVIATARACWSNDGERRAGSTVLNGSPASIQEGSFAFPVLVGDEVVAVVEFFAPESDAPDPTLVEAMMHVGTQLGRVVERRRLQQELVDAVWEQQREFGQEIHDTLGQELTGIGMLAGSIARKLTSQNIAGADTVHELAQMIQHAKQGTRRLAKGLLPVEVDAQGLAAALEELAEATRQRCRIDVEVQCDRSLHLEDNHVATHLFRIAQEAVTNAVKHASATCLGLDLSHHPDGILALTVADNGAGIAPANGKQPRGVGLRIMRYRAQVIGAELDIRRGAAGGTTVTCRLRRRH